MTKCTCFISTGRDATPVVNALLSVALSVVISFTRIMILAMDVLQMPFPNRNCYLPMMHTMIQRAGFAINSPVKMMHGGHPAYSKFLLPPD